MENLEQINKGDFLYLPSDLCITLIGLKTLPYRVVKWGVLDLYARDGSQRIVLKRGKKVHDAYLDKTIKKIEYLNNLS